MNDTFSELLTALLIGAIAAAVVFGAGRSFIGWIVEDE